MRIGGIGGSMFLVAVGAILYWAVSAEMSGIDLDVVGIILMVVGIVGLVLTLIMTASVTEQANRSAAGGTTSETPPPRAPGHGPIDEDVVER